MIADIMVVEADYSIRKILGGPFLKIIGPFIPEAEKVIPDYAYEFRGYAVNQYKALHNAAHGLQTGIHPSSLEPVIDAAFASKSTAGLCDSPLATKMAKSLDAYCHKLLRESQPLTFGALDVIIKHVSAIGAIFAEGITGDKDALTLTVLDEFDRLTDSPMRLS